MFRRLAVAGLVAMGSIITEAQAQQPADLVRTIFRSGPRFGVTYLPDSTVALAKSKHGIDLRTVITQFGWQYERQFASVEGGVVALNEFVLLVGGLDQGTAIPSITWLVGVRTPAQFEMGVGPNATPDGVALAISVGQTFKSGALSIPVNIAVVPSKEGVRASILTGFNIYR